MQPYLPDVVLLDQLGGIHPERLGGIHKHHFPTGRVSLEDVLHLAIKEFGAKPARADWEEVLEETQATYEALRTWP